VDKPRTDRIRAVRFWAGYPIWLLHLRDKEAEMTQDDVIRMAREAGCHEASHPMNPWSVSQEALERFAALVAAAEREDLICICEKWAKSGGEFSLLDAIRARGQG
jgi:hypothetical protein